MIKLAYVFRTAPHGTSVSREGLDALLAATAFCDEKEIAVYFMDDGVLNLLKQQQPAQILQKDYIPMFRLLDLYDIENRYACVQSLQRFSLNEQDLVLNLQKIDRTLLMRQLNQAEKILVF